MHNNHAEIVICGAGIAGVSAAYYLAVKYGLRDIVLVDPREPLSFTSDKSTECYRNWWPGPGDEMVRYMNTSIDLLDSLADESDNIFHLNRRGYLFVTADPQRAEELARSARDISNLGAGELRVHERAAHTAYVPHQPEGYRAAQEGADLFLDPALIQQYFPYVTPNAVAALHARRCGWFSAQQLGMYLLQKAQAAGVTLVAGEISAVETAGNRVRGVTVQLNGGGEKQIATSRFLNAAGPYVGAVSEMIGVSLPVFNELHGKIAIKDSDGVIPRDAPMVIWEDPVQLYWSAAEKAELAEIEELSWLLDTFPPGVHFRPEGAGDSPILLVLWTYDLEPHEVVPAPAFAPDFPEIVLRGLVRMIPGLRPYIGRMGKPYIDGGYYCKTKENRPLIGPLPVEGAYVFGALSGYGIMASQAGADLIAAHITGGQLPPYEWFFRLERYADPAYQRILDAWGAATGQL